MKKIIFILFALVTCALSTGVYAQSGPPAPGAGIWTIIDTTYQVGTSTLGQSKARITLKNATISKYTGIQTRIFYDKDAFASASVALVGSPTNLYLQSVDSNATGYVTLSLVYTGNSSTYTLADGETFEITFTHVAAASFYALPSISALTFSGAASFTTLAASQTGLDTTLSKHSYGGVWEQPTLDFQGKFTNVTGTGAKNLTLALEKKVKAGGTWGTHDTYVTDLSGNFAFSEIIDTTYYDVRLAIKGDTMTVGNVISTADAQLINQWVLGSATPSGFDFYTADVNGSTNVTITDAYGVFGRIAGRFTEWPNAVEDVKFFTAAQYTTITGSPSTNYTSTYAGVTNFYYDILPGQPDSVQYYVLVPGDANGTGYNMARLTPIEVMINPPAGTPAQTENVIDMTVEYDFPTSSIEVNLPNLSVNSGNLVEIPVTVKTGGKDISSLQLAMLYDQTLLEFKDITNSAKSMQWMSSFNPTGGIIEWAGYDPSANKSYMIPDNYEVFKLRFIALKPQIDWEASPLYTSRKFSGDNQSRDLSITAANGILIVAKMAGPSGQLDNFEITAFPNPTTGEISFDFSVKNSGMVKLVIVDLNGSEQFVILDQDMPAGKYVYSSNINQLTSGLYVASLQAVDQINSTKIIKK
jgi:hypothetical protein